MVTLTYLSVDSEEYQADYARAMATRTGPFLTADSTIRTIEERLAKFQKNLSLARPDLAKADWDITIKEGKIKVTGDVSANDKRDMEARLNGDQSLVLAIQGYMGAAQAYLETNELNPSYHGENEVTGSMTLYNFKDVMGQLEGTISFKELIKASWKPYEHPKGGPLADPGNFRGYTSLEVLASRLTSTPLDVD